MAGLTAAKNRFFSLGYKRLIRPVFFRQDPERVHDRMIASAAFLGRHAFTWKMGKKIFSFEDPALKQEIAGLEFKNPVGLAAGFDKNARAIGFLPAVGFGFAEVGSITSKPCAGNAVWHIKRLPLSQSIAVNYGLMNDGVDAIKDRVASFRSDMVIGTNIAFTNIESINTPELAVADYADSFMKLADIGSYFTINISCPNRNNDRMFWEPKNFESLLKKIFEIKTKKPVFIKLSPDMPDKTLDELIEAAARFPIAGFVISNLTKNRENPNIKDAEVPEVGGLSGKVVEPLTNKAISYVYQKTGGKFPIIACGGIFSAEDAYKKIKLGASLVELITGLIYEGPQLVSDINLGLVGLLKNDGYDSIQKAVGKDNEIV